MHRERLFRGTLAAFILVYLAYGLHRLTLGLDLTDEGAFLAWPLRTLLGERPFASDPLTLFRPIEVYLYLPFKLHPAMTLYEFRLLGWMIHLAAFGVLARCLFRLGAGPWQSPVIASVPFFVSHIFGIALPSYNPLCSDFLAMALAFRALGGLAIDRGATALHAAGGAALFLATFAHPALGLVAVGLIARELTSHRFAANLIRCRLAPSNIGMAMFLICWLVFAVYFFASGAFTNWRQRLPLESSGNALNDPMDFFIRLAFFPFTHSPIARGVTLVSFLGIGFMAFNARSSRERPSGHAAALLAVLLAAALVLTFSYEPGGLPVRLVQVCLILVAVCCLGPRAGVGRVDPEIRFLLLMSCLGAVLCATFTFYFSPFRSWVSGALALPFAFGAGFALLLKEVAPAQIVRLLPVAVLGLATICAGSDHYRSIYRDGAPAELNATIQLPKLRSIRTTPERAAALEELFAYLRPKLTRGERLLAYDHCPMLYYLFDAMPGYGLTWAYTARPANLRQLNAELNAKPLPRYAIRALVDVSHPVWRTAPRVSYADYPLNETVEANYTLDRTIFPFEVWRLRTADR